MYVSDLYFYDTEKEKEKLKKQAKEAINMFKHTGKLVINKRTGERGIILREWETGQILVCESVTPLVCATHDSWATLEFLDNQNQSDLQNRNDICENCIHKGTLYCETSLPCQP